jgi:branched-chain amino acid transport system permease protein
MKTLIRRPDLPADQAPATGWKPAGSTARRIALIVAGAVLIDLFCSLALPAYYIYLSVLTAYAAIGAVALDLLLGYVGQVSIGNSAYMAIGAFAAVGVQHYGGFLTGLLAGLIAGAAAGLVTGLVSLRLRGFYVVLTSLALLYIASFAFQEIESATGAIAGYNLPIPSIGSFELNSDRRWLAVGLVLLVIELVVLGILIRGRTGRAWLAIREHESAASVVGVNVVKYKLLAWVLSSAFIGLQGAMLAYYLGSVDYASYTLELSVSYAAMVLIGGLGTLYGPILGAIIVTLVPSLLNDIGSGGTTGYIGSNASSIELLIYGALIIVIVLLDPGGLWGIARRAAAAVRRTLGRRKAGRGLVAGSGTEQA